MIIRIAAIDCSGDGADGGDIASEICFRKPFQIRSFPSFRLFPQHSPLNEDRSKDYPGMKRTLDQTTSMSQTDKIWTGTNVADLRRMAIEFVTPKMDQNKVPTKPISVAQMEEVIKNAKENEIVTTFFEEKKDVTMRF